LEKRRSAREEGRWEKKKRDWWEWKGGNEKEAAEGRNGDRRAREIEGFYGEERKRERQRKINESIMRTRIF